MSRIPLSQHSFRRKSSSATEGIIQLVPVQHLDNVDEMQVNGFYNDYDDDEDTQFDRNYVVDVLSGKNLALRTRIADILEGRPHRKDATVHIIFNFMSLVAIIISIIVFSLSTLPANYNPKAGINVDDPFVWVEVGCIAFFVLEVILRLVCVPWVQLKNMFFGIDILAIVGFFVDLITDLVGQSSNSGASLLRILRLLRVLRIFKLSRHSKSLQLVFIVMKNSASGLTALLLPFTIVVLLSSCFIYFFEILNLSFDRKNQVWVNSRGVPGQFQSIPDAIWFASVTITTVGYGDLFPDSIEGKIVGVIIAFIGVLILSFPNIILGGNLQFAFRVHYMIQSRKNLGRKFRKVMNLIIFVKVLKERALERADLKLREEEFAPSQPPNPPQDAAEADPNVPSPLITSPSDHILSRNENTLFHSNSDQSSSLKTRPSIADAGSARQQKKMYYLMTKSELEVYKRDDMIPITHDNVRTWEYNGISAVQWMQRLLELCSGTGTTEELLSSFCTDIVPVPDAADIALIGLYLFEAGYVHVFVFRRQAVNMLFTLAPPSVQELLLHKEDLHAECIRGLEMAKMVWKRTTMLQSVVILQPLQTNYLQWACAERMVDNSVHTPLVDLKLNLGMKSKAVKSRHVSRRSSSLQTTFGGRSSSIQVSHAIPVDVARAKLKAVVEKQMEHIQKLQTEIFALEQNVATSFGL